MMLGGVSIGCTHLYNIIKFIHPKAQHEGHLRDALEDEVDAITRMDGVTPLQEYTDGHLEHPKSTDSFIFMELR